MDEFQITVGYSVSYFVCRVMTLKELSLFYSIYASNAREKKLGFFEPNKKVYVYPQLMQHESFTRKID